MKNKTLTYLLIPVVIGIWGYIFYNLYSKLARPDKNSVKTSEFVPSASSEKLTATTFSITANYRDPFLKKPNEIKKQIVSKSIAIPNKKLDVGWPQLAYSGIIKNQTGNKQLVLLRINGKQNRMQVNQSIDEITLLKVTRDSVFVKFGKETKYLKR